MRKYGMLNGHVWFLFESFESLGAIKIWKQTHVKKIPGVIEM